MRADIISTNYGTIITITAASKRGQRWMAAHVAGGRAASVQCDHRYGIDILLGALDAGLRLKDASTGRIAVSA